MEKQVKGLPPKPEEPGLDECCGSGCVRCVYDIYYEKLEKWERLRETLLEQQMDSGIYFSFTQL